MVLDRILGKQDLAIPSVARKTGLERGLNDVVEEEGAVNEQTESGDLEPLERFPA
jgi:hypothetical protein